MLIASITFNLKQRLLHFNLHIEIDSELVVSETSQLMQWFQFFHCDLPIYIPAESSYGVFISRLIQYISDCDSYHDFLDQ